MSKKSKLPLFLFITLLSYPLTNYGQKNISDEMIEKAQRQTKKDGAIKGAFMLKGQYIIPFETTSKAYRIYQKKISQDNKIGNWNNTYDYLAIDQKEKRITAFENLNEDVNYPTGDNTYYLQGDLDNRTNEFFAIDDHDRKVILRLEYLKDDLISLTVSSFLYRIEYRIQGISLDEK